MAIINALTFSPLARPINGKIGSAHGSTNSLSTHSLSLSQRSSQEDLTGFRVEDGSSAKMDYNGANRSKSRVVFSHRSSFFLFFFFFFIFLFSFGPRHHAERAAGGPGDGNALVLPILPGPGPQELHGHHHER